MFFCNGSQKQGKNNIPSQFWFWGSYYTNTRFKVYRYEYYMIKNRGLLKITSTYPFNTEI